MTNTIKQLAMHTGDADIKQLLLENNVTIERPAPPNDLAIIAVKDKRHRYVWLVLRFFQPGDDGYLAFGLPDSTPEADIRTVFAFLLEPYQGKPGHVVALPPLQFN